MDLKFLEKYKEIVLKKRGFIEKHKKLVKFGIIVLIVLSIFGILNLSQKPEKSVVKINGMPIYVEIASTPQQHRQGLMYRNRLKLDHGMLFIFDFEGNHTFWMKNTFIPLDIIWLNDNKEIVHIEHSAPPCNTEPCISYRSQYPSRYVLEVNGGWAINNGVVVGNKAEF